MRGRRYMMSALLTPGLGYLVDRHGGRAALALASSVVLLVVHLLLALTSLPAELVLAGLGLGYSVFAAVIWPGVAYVVEPQQLGTACAVGRVSDAGRAAGVVGRDLSRACSAGPPAAAASQPPDGLPLAALKRETEDPGMART